MVEGAQRFRPLQYVGAVGLGKVECLAVRCWKKQHLLVEQPLQVAQEISRFLVRGQHEYEGALLQLVACHGHHRIGRPDQPFQVDVRVLALQGLRQCRYLITLAEFR